MRDMLVTELKSALILLSSSRVVCHLHSSWTLSGAKQRQQELKADWDLAQNSQPPLPIQP